MDNMNGDVRADRPNRGGVRFLAAIVVLGAVIAVGGAAWSMWKAPVGPPPILSGLSLAEALAQNRTDDRLLLVKGTAKWCGPCQSMDRSTLRDEALVAWMKEHGTAIALDVDQSPAEARRLAIAAMPTLIVFRGGEELDRVVGYRSGEQLLEWLSELDRRARRASHVRVTSNAINFATRR